MRIEIGKNLPSSYSMASVKDVSTLVENSDAYVWRHPIFDIEVYFAKWSKIGVTVADLRENVLDAAEKELAINTCLLLEAFKNASVHSIEALLLQQRGSGFADGVRHARVKMREALGLG